MKKTLVALAALAVVGAASAQSSVTMYGVADLGFSDSNVAGVKGSMSGNGTMNNGSSRLGVRGTEDLGGGLKASFNFEQGINAETGATDAAAFQRAANMSVSGGFGTVKMGRTLSPNFFGVATWELSGAANYSAVASKFGYSGSARNNSEFSYASPVFSGFSGQVAYVFPADNGGLKAAAANLKYVAGPVAAALAVSQLQGQGGKTWSLGAKYDFGMFAVAGSLQNPIGVKKGFTIGGTANLGPVGLTLDLARDTGSLVKSTDVMLEAKYPLSKRTFVYASALRDGDGSAAVAAKLATSTAFAVPAVAAVPANTAFGLGIRHNF